MHTSIFTQFAAKVVQWVLPVSYLAAASCRTTSSAINTAETRHTADSIAISASTGKITDISDDFTAEIDEWYLYPGQADSAGLHLHRHITVTRNNRTKTLHRDTVTVQEKVETAMTKENQESSQSKPQSHRLSWLFFAVTAILTTIYILKK